MDKESVLRSVPAGIDADATLEKVRARVFGEEGPAPGSSEDSLPYLRSNHMLLRFLTARQWDVEEAVAMLRGHYAWLASRRVEDLLSQYFPEEDAIRKCYPETYHGVDKAGRPLYIWQPGRIDVVRLMDATTPERLLEYLIVGCEKTIRSKLPACSLARGEVVDKSLNIVDLEGLSFRMISNTTAQRIIKEFTAITSNHYPETMGRMIIVNAPFIFAQAWKIVSSMLDQKTLDKITIFGANKKAYSKALMDLVDPDQLPRFLGGACICNGSDPLSCMTSAKGPWTRPEVTTLLESHPLDFLMSTEGASLLVQQAASEVEAGSGGCLPIATDKVPCAREEDSTRGSQKEEVAGSAHQVEVLVDRDAQDQPPLDCIAEQSIATLQNEYKREAEAHKQTLVQWLEEFGEQREIIGTRCIERAQQYYDKRALWNHAAREYANQHDELEEANVRFKEAVAELSAAEVENQVPSRGQLDGRISFASETWNAAVAPHRGKQESLDAVDDPALSRMTRIAALVDRLRDLQGQRDEALRRLETKSCQVEEARKRFNLEAEKHGRCNCNCSIVLAAPLFERRQIQEATISAQMAKLHSLERRLQEAGERRGPQESEGTLSRSTSFFSVMGGEMSPTFFDLPVLGSSHVSGDHDNDCSDGGESLLSATSSGHRCEDF